jgi:hypothetical protein
LILLIDTYFSKQHMWRGTTPRASHSSSRASAVPMRKWGKIAI